MPPTRTTASAPVRRLNGAPLSRHPAFDPVVLPGRDETASPASPGKPLLRRQQDRSLMSPIYRATSDCFQATGRAPAGRGNLIRCTIETGIRDGALARWTRTVRLLRRRAVNGRGRTSLHEWRSHDGRGSRQPTLTIRSRKPDTNSPAPWFVPGAFRNRR